MSADTTQHLARITAVEPSDAHRVLSIGNLMLYSALLVVLQAGWTLPLLVGLFMHTPYSVLGPDGFAAAIRFLLLLVALVWMVAQFGLVVVYPEWPLNRVLCRRMRSSLQLRDDRLVSAFDPATRVVELVPRERWRKLSFETATDLMVMRIDDDGVSMSGDSYRYELPCGSILDAELLSIKPPGWFTKTHMVILTVRTAGGPMELPLSYRDHWFGTLRSSIRKQQAFDLTERITRIAKGQQFETLHVESREPAQRWSDNPYAAPAI